MADSDLVQLLRCGAGEWNQWRLDHLNVPLNLQGANLRDSDLRQVNLQSADLTSATLNGSDLSDAVLRHSTLTEAAMQGCVLRNADLTQIRAERSNIAKTDAEGATFTRALLRSALLSEADFSNADFLGAKLGRADLYRARFRGASAQGVEFSGCNLKESDFRESDLTAAELQRADLSGAYFDEADLSSANLWGAVAEQTSFRKARLVGATIVACQFIRTDFRQANLTDCAVYGIAAWELMTDEAIQSNLLITPTWMSDAGIRVDNLEVAQFIHLLITNEKIRTAIDTITSKVVLILGRFTPARKIILDAMRDDLRKRGYLPVLFDFEKPRGRDLTETISTLAHMARFVIADITDARSIPQELMAIVPTLPSVPVQPLLLSSQGEYGMFEHFKRYPWVLPVYVYNDENDLLSSLGSNVIGPAEDRARVRGAS